MVLWGAAAAVCLFTVLLLWRAKAPRRDQHFILSSGLLTALLLADDALLLHETVLPLLLGVGEASIYAVYLGLIAAHFLVFWRQVRATAVLPVGGRPEAARNRELGGLPHQHVRGPAGAGPAHPSGRTDLIAAHLLHLSGEAARAHQNSVSRHSMSRRRRRRSSYAGRSRTRARAQRTASAGVEA
jgi:hypothetical protein